MSRLLGADRPRLPQANHPAGGDEREFSASRKELDSRLELLTLAQKLGNITEACRALGYSRDSFYRFRSIFASGGEEALKRLTRKKPLLKTRISPLIETRIVSLSKQHPTWGRQRVAKAIRKEGHPISGSGVRCVWLRHNLRQVAAVGREPGPAGAPPLDALEGPSIRPSPSPGGSDDRQGLIIGRGKRLPASTLRGEAPFRLEATDLGQLTHMVATRAGLYAVSQAHYMRVAEGNFFGMSWEPDHLYCFEASGNHLDNNGRLVDLRIENGSIRSCRIALTGIPNGTHQIDYVGEDLLLCDTYNSRIIQLSAAFDVKGEFFPTGHPRPKDYPGGYSHINSLVCHKGRIFVLKHNGTGSSGRNSELAELDDQFHIVAARILPGGDCHNVVFLENDEPIFCDSLNGNIIDSNRVVTHIGAVFTRGLSVDPTGIVVGYSEYSRQADRVGVAGGVCFLDRNYVVKARLDLPAAPTEIRRLDAVDYSLSNCPLRTREHPAAVPYRSRRSTRQPRAQLHDSDG